jgi:hypothetical protein
MEEEISIKYICKNCEIEFVGKNPQHEYKFCSLKCFYH